MSAEERAEKLGLASYSLARDIQKMVAEHQAEDVSDEDQIAVKYVGVLMASHLISVWVPAAAVPVLNTIAKGMLDTIAVFKHDGIPKT